MQFFFISHSWKNQIAFQALKDGKSPLQLVQMPVVIVERFGSQNASSKYILVHKIGASKYI
jgi:hypothetical protein